MARALGLTIIPVVSKSDSPLARVAEVTDELVVLLGCRKEEVLACSGKTGAGVAELLSQIVTRVPPPKVEEHNDFRALVFDFKYSDHRGVIMYIRVVDGAVKKGDTITLKAAEEKRRFLPVLAKRGRG